MRRNQYLRILSMSRRSSKSSQNNVFAIDDEIAPPCVNNGATNTEISFDGLLDPPLLLHEDLKEGCGGQLWPAGMVLSKYMLTYHRSDLANTSM